jgi:Mg2+ and Co2+ transporter CorA
MAWQEISEQTRTALLEPVISDLTQDIDDVKDAMLDGSLAPLQQTLNELQRRIVCTRRHVNYIQQVLDPMTTDPTLALDADDCETLVRASTHVTRYLQRLDECRTRVQTLGDQIEAQRSEIMTRSSPNLTIVATVFLPLTFITGLLGMNVAGIPDQHDPVWFLACNRPVCHHFHAGLAIAASSNVCSLSGSGKHRQEETGAIAGNNYTSSRWHGVSA